MPRRNSQPPVPVDRAAGLPWPRFAAIFGIVLLASVCGFASFGGLLGPTERIAAALMRILQAGAPAALYLLAAVGLGALVRPLFARSPDAAPLQAAAGLALMLWISHLLGISGGLGPAGSAGPWIAITPIAIGCLLLLGQLWGQRSRQPGIDQPVEPARTSPHPLWILAAVPIGLLLVAAANPPGTLWASEGRGYDVLSYHAMLPREWLANGQLWPLPHNVYSYLPSYIEAAFLHLLSMTFAAAGSEATPGAIAADGWRLMSFSYLHAGVTIFAAWLTAHAAARLVAGGAGRDESDTTARRRFAGAVAGLVVLCTPWTLVVGSLAYNELAVVALLAAAIIAAADRGLSPWIRGGLAGILIGAACGAKPTAIFMAAPLAGIVLLGSLPPRAWPAAVATGCIAGLAMIAPWLIRNTIDTGNPVFPHASSLFGAGHWSAEQVDRYIANHHFHGGFGQRLRLMFLPETGGADIFRHRGVLHPQWAILFPLTLVAAAIAMARTAVRSAALLLAAGLLLQLAAWLTLTHIQSRFLLPCVAPAAILIGIAAAGLRPAGVGVIAGVLIVAVQLMASVRTFAVQNDGAPNTMLAVGSGFITGVPLRAEFAALPPAQQRSQIDQLGVQAFINLVVPPHLRLLIVGGSPELYIERPAEYARVWDTSTLADIIKADPDNPAAWTRSLRAAGYDLILIDFADLMRLEQSGFLDPTLATERLERWMTTHALLVKDWPEVGVFLLAPVDPTSPRGPEIESIAPDAPALPGAEPRP